MDPKKKTKFQADIIKAQQTAIKVMDNKNTLATITAIEDKVLADSSKIVSELLGFADITFLEDGTPQYPDSWNDLPTEELQRRVRVAKLGYMPTADIPHGAKIAVSCMVAIIKARAAKETGTKVLNIENAVFPSPSPLKDDIEVLDVDE
jgi:hypothetical protein